MHGAVTTARAIPDGLVTDGPYEDSVVGVLKSGKEAGVFLVERVSAAGTCLLAHKRYRPRHPTYKGELRDLGFSKGTIYRSDRIYREGWNLRARDRRAVETGSPYGQALRVSHWPDQEFAILGRAWEAGACVPYPVSRTEDGVLMEFIGDRAGVAPRLVDARLGPGDVAGAWAQLVEGVRRLLAAGIVHADLSAYNLLWWQGRLVIIDLPQAVEREFHPAWAELLERDIANVARWFTARGLAVDAGSTIADLLAIRMST